MEIFVYVPMTVLAVLTILILYRYTERDSIKVIIFFGVIAAVGLLTMIICNLLGLHTSGSDYYTPERGAGPFRW
jgi:hypothetical protein